MDNARRSISTFAGRFKVNHMKIAVLDTRRFPDVPGGVEKYCERFYAQFVKKGCEVVVLVRQPYVGEESIGYKGVRVVPAQIAQSNGFIDRSL